MTVDSRGDLDPHWGMHRSVALVAFLALSWSQVVALGCDMAAGAGDRTPATAATASPHHPAAMQHVATTAADQHKPDQAPPVRHGQGHGGDHGCQMIMSCGYSFVRHAQSAVITRFPGIAVRAAYLTDPVPVAAELVVETPPPRLTA